MSEELKPCPFCGGEACYIATEEGFTAYLRIGCKTCWAKSNPVRYRTYYNGLDDEKNPIPPESMKKEAAATWNRRDDADRIAELEHEVAEQYRLNGMGAEREATLMGKVERLERQNAELRRRAAPPVSEQDGKDARYLTDDDMASLIRFAECCEDSDADGHDVPKDRVTRLCELGVLRSLGFGKCEITAFGSYVIEHASKRNPPLPLKTICVLLAHR